MGPSPCRSDQPEPFSFKDDTLGMSLEDFKVKHLNPGIWQDKDRKSILGGVDFHKPPSGKGRWKWKPDMDCKVIQGEISRCEYKTTAAGISSAHVAAVFVEQKLAVITVSFSGQGSVVKNALTDKLGPPVQIGASGRSNRKLSALRWDNDVSIVEFQEKYCGNGISSHKSLEGWSKDVTEILRGTYCENGDAAESGHAFIWYVHKSLSNLAMTRWKEAIEDVKEKLRSEPFSFDDSLGMSLEAFKAKHKKFIGRCTETAKATTGCYYNTSVLGINAIADAVFVDDKLAVIHIWYPRVRGRAPNRFGVPVDVKQALITKFGSPEVIYGETAYWDDGVSVVEYQVNNCSDGKAYEKITKILQKRSCEKTKSWDGTFSIWYVHKDLSALVITRLREAEETNRKKARSDL